jgi:hypothetical protein
MTLLTKRKEISTNQKKDKYWNKIFGDNYFLFDDWQKYITSFELEIHPIKLI